MSKKAPQFLILPALLLLLIASCQTTTAEQREAERFVREQIKHGNCLVFYAYTNGTVPPAGPTVVVTPHGLVGPLADVEWAKCPGKCPQWDSGCRSMEEKAAKAAKAAKKKERYCAEHPSVAECQP